MRCIEDIINQANYLLSCQKDKLLCEVDKEDIQPNRATIISFLENVLGIYESDLTTADNTAIDSWLGG